MKKKSILLTAILSIVSLSAFALVGPKVEIDNSGFDFGFAPQNAKLSHTFWIKSTGDEDLKIVKVIPGCGCTKAPLAKDVINPGDSTTLEIIFSSKKYTGTIIKQPKFLTNTEDNNQVLAFQATIVNAPDSTYPLVISPFNLELAGMRPEIDNARFMIENKSEEDISIIVVEAATDFFTTKMPKKIKAGEKAEGMLQLLAASADKSFAKSVTIELSDAAKTRYTIPVTYSKPAMTISNK